MEEGKGKIHIGIGGWTFAPWRGPFYPEGLTQKRELEYAAQQLTSIEINGTYYGAQKPESFAKWRNETPAGFVFSVKGPRFATNRRELAQSQESVERFVSGGVLELGDRLGPINWQFLDTKAFDAEDFGNFLSLLPKTAEGRALRHVVEVRHPSFAAPEFVALARRHGVGIAIAADSKFPQIADLTADFVYLRLMGTSADHPLGYPDTALDAWAKRLAALSRGEMPKGLETVSDAPADGKPKDVFAYVISGEKVRNPAAAMALIEKISKLQ